MLASVIIVLMLFMLYHYWETIKINLMIYTIVSRGILAPQQFMWSFSDWFLDDGSGINLYRNLKAKYKRPVVDIKMFGYDIKVLTNIHFIKQLLDNSPTIFGVGKGKMALFRSFMEKNVGVSENPVWKPRRLMNEKVLHSDKPHGYNALYSKYIKKQFDEGVPQSGTDFMRMTQRLATKVIFNDVHDPNIYRVFQEANSIWSQILGGVTISDETMAPYMEYLNKNIIDPKPDSLIEIAVSSTSNTSREELIHQIPHWMFPISGLGITIARALLFIYTHPKHIEVIQKDQSFVRNIVLETLRLNNPVITSFRTLLQDYAFNSEYKYKKGDQFLILNNPILREPEFFKSPDQFVPERWTPSMEKSYYALMFNQGPQRCPGKELAITLASQNILEFLARTQYLTLTCEPSIDTHNIPQMINPFAIKFTV